MRLNFIIFRAVRSYPKIQGDKAILGQHLVEDNFSGPRQMATNFEILERPSATEVLLHPKRRTLGEIEFVPGPRRCSAKVDFLFSSFELKAV